MIRNLFSQIRIWFINRQIVRETKGEPDFPCYHCGNPAPPGTTCFRCGLESQFEE